MVLAKKSSSPTGSVVDQELAHDEANPQPGPGAKAELARLKAARGGSSETGGTGSDARVDSSDTSEHSNQDRSAPPPDEEKVRPRGKKTL